MSKHYTKSEQAGQQGLDELLSQGLIKTTVRNRTILSVISGDNDLRKRQFVYQQNGALNEIWLQLEKPKGLEWRPVSVTILNTERADELERKTVAVRDADGIWKVTSRS